jgi:hypothetical protein
MGIEFYDGRYHHQPKSWTASAYPICVRSARESAKPRADDRTRTRYILFTREVLYPVSYIGTARFYF